MSFRWTVVDFTPMERVSVPDQLPENGEQFGLVDGFGDEAVTPGVEAGGLFFLHRAGGHGDDRQCFAEFPQLPCRSVAVHDWHLHVEQQCVIR